MQLKVQRLTQAANATPIDLNGLRSTRFTVPGSPTADFCAGVPAVEEFLL
jgi:hypothetical protein